MKQSLKIWGIEESRYKLVRASQDDKYYHPGRTAYIMIGKEVVGVVGNIHPLMEKKYNVKDVYIVELNLTTLLNLKNKQSENLLKSQCTLL